MMWYDDQQPHWNHHRTKLEIFVEWMALVIAYHSILFSQHSLNEQAVFKMDYTYIFFISSLVFVNFANIFMKQTKL